MIKIACVFFSFQVVFDRPGIKIFSRFSDKRFNLIKFLLIFSIKYHLYLGKYTSTISWFKINAFDLMRFLNYLYISTEFINLLLLEKIFLSLQHSKFIWRFPFWKLCVLKLILKLFQQLSWSKFCSSANFWHIWGRAIKIYGKYI